MTSYLDYDEEAFELMYEDDLNVLNEQDAIENVPSQSNTQQSQPILPSQPNLPDPSQPLPSSQIEPEDSALARKRTIEELFGEFDDLFNESDLQPLKKQKGDVSDDLALIDYILELRNVAKQKKNALAGPIIQPIDHRALAKENYSFTEPNYLHWKLKTDTGRTVFVRYHSDEVCAELQLELVKEITTKSRQEAVAAPEPVQPAAALSQASVRISDPVTNLWVEEYKPRQYRDLLSDEAANRSVLAWLRLWERAVFGRRSGAPQPEELDASSRPLLKVVLLHGPPGVGKTTLAHVAARHAGYNAVEVNASDDRSIDAFRTVLVNATEMRSVLAADRRPNCLIFDEIDGAPPATVSFLVRYVKGGGGKRKEPKTVRRPIVCICNDLYATALRPLREVAFVVGVPPVSSRRLAERLLEIAETHKIKTDLGAMLALATKSGNDTRLAINTLQFYRTKRSVTLADVNRSNIGEKDDRKKYFETLRKLFVAERGCSDGFRSCLSSFNDYELLLNGVFDNYLAVFEFRNRKELGMLPEALNWLTFNDFLAHEIYAKQEFELFKFLPYAFVYWHVHFASKSQAALTFLKFPDSDNQARKHRQRHTELINQLISGLKPTIRIHTQRITLILDILPYLKWLIVPKFRAINLNLHTDYEKSNLDEIVAIMLDYNLGYIQENGPNGLVFELDPNVYNEAIFGELPEITLPLKRIISQQLQRQRIQANTDGIVKENHYNTLKKNKPAMPGHKSQPKPMFSFQKSPVAKSSTENQLSKSGTQFTQDIWFQFKEGYSNAVRRPLKMSQLK